VPRFWTWSTVLGAAMALLVWGPASRRDVAETSTDVVTRHVEAMRDFQALLAEDPAKALARAQEEAAATRRLGPNDARRGDVLERLALALAAAERYDEALPVARETVRIRKVAHPPSNELVALALGMHAMLLFANGQAEAADAALRDALTYWRRAYGPNDLRLAQKLENDAELAQAGFGRTHWAIELLEEAARIRRETPNSSPGRLAQTLQGLAIHQLSVAAFTEAEANLVAAQALLEQGTTATEKAGLVQVLMLRSGLALRLARHDDALALADRAAAIDIPDRVEQVDTVAPLALLRSTILEARGDVDGASDALVGAVEVFEQNRDLVDDGKIDRELVVDVVLEIAALDLRHGLREEAADALVIARRARGDTSEVLFLAAELERQRGDEAAALHFYRRALQLRRTDATEIKVFFGTNRRQLRHDPPAFSGDAGSLTIGEALVLVPGGQFSTEAWLPNAAPLPIPVGQATNAERMLIRKLRVLTPETFGASAARAVSVARLYPSAALVFVHGYNVTFDEAIRRGAQLARDLNFDGPVGVFAWPSKGMVWRYGTDRVTADASASELERFLRHVQGATGVSRVHVIAHSMGNRVLLPALAAIAEARDQLSTTLGEVILAAPAVPQRAFVEWIDRLSTGGVRRITLYASAMDKALLAGYIREWGTVLAGRVANGEPLTHDVVHSIDLSSASDGAGVFDLNHDTFASNPVITEDIRQLLQHGTRPPERRLTALALQKTATGREFWVYRPSTLSTGGETSPR
jgi:esterase/lipase superfamily enzyme/tetratricopeptide (TPR) repeat protein